MKSKVMIYPTEAEKTLFHHAAKLNGKSLSQFIIDNVNNSINNTTIPEYTTDKTIVLIPNSLLEAFKEHTNDISQFLIESTMAYIATQEAPAPQHDTKPLEDYISKLEAEIRSLKEPAKSEVDTMARKMYDFILSSKGKKFIKENDLRALFTIESEEDNDNFYIALHVFQERYAHGDIKFSSKVHGWRRLK